MIETVIWDWNGTLLDDSAQNLGVINSMLRDRGLPALSPERYRSIFRFPVVDFYADAGFPIDSQPFSEMADDFIARYTAASRDCTLRHGAAGALERLRAAGIHQVIISASGLDMLRSQVISMGIGGYFDELVGAGNAEAHGKIDIARKWMAKTGADASKCVWVGDCDHDYEVSTAIGVRCVLIPGGHQSVDRLRSCGCDVMSDLPQTAEYLLRSRG